MKHVVQLSNGRTLVIEESKDAINIGLGEKINYIDIEGVIHVEYDIDAYVSQINCDGVLIYNTSGDACIELAKGLGD